MKRSKEVIILISVLVLFLVNVAAYAVNAESSEEYEEEKVVYLTFDDGPSFIVTDKILDILKAEDVKATFFVVGSKISGKEEILKRIHSEGHSIGLHTYSHVYKKIYSSHDNFIKEMDDTAMEVNRVLGYMPRDIRFPSGSKPHMDYALLEKLHNKKYRIYDWNASLSDGLNYNIPADKLAQEAHKIIGSKKTKVFLLLHCDQCNMNTVKALPSIIEYYRNLGYKFKPITDNTPEYHFRITK